VKKINRILGAALILLVFVASVSNIFAEVKVESVIKLPSQGTNIDYSDSNITSSEIKTKADKVMGTFVFLVQIACVATVIIMGLRYILTSAEGKANVKKDLVVWCVGAFIVFGATTLIGLVLNVVTGKQYVTITPNEKSEEQIQKENEKEVSVWATEDWDNAKKAGLIPASIKNTPKAKISRGEFVEAAYSLVDNLADKYEINLTEPEDKDIADVTSSSLKRKILKLYNLGIITGTGVDFEGNITFEPDSDITRQDVAAILYRFLQKTNETGGFSMSEADKTNALYAEIPEYAKEAMIYMNKNEIIKGDGNSLNPKGNTTCEEAITIIYRIYEMYSEDK